MTKELEAARERLGALETVARLHDPDANMLYGVYGGQTEEARRDLFAADLRTLLDAKGEVVAWRWRFTGEAYGVEGALPGGWRHQDEKPEFRASEAWKREVQPLYAHTGGGDE